MAMVPPLFVRSYYSLLAGCRSPGDLLSSASRMGYRTVVLVDRYNFYGTPVFFREARRLGMHPLAGITFPSAKITLLCLNEKGFARANELAAVFHRDRMTLTPDKNRKRGSTVFRQTELLQTGTAVRQDLLERGWEGLIVLSASSSVLSDLAKRQRNGLYLSILYGGPAGDTAALAREPGIKPFAVTDVVWLDKGDPELFHLLNRIGSRSGEVPAPLVTGVREHPRFADQAAAASVEREGQGVFV